MTEQFDRRFGLDPYLDWVAKEGIPVTENYGIDLFEVETGMWPRFGVKGAAVHLMIRRGAGGIWGARHAMHVRFGVRGRAPAGCRPGKTRNSRAGTTASGLR